MEAVIKSATFWDEWLRPRRRFLRTTALEPCEMKNYVLGFRFEATARELRLIEANKMFSHVAIILGAKRSERLTFADLLSPELIPEVHWSLEHLLKFECRIREAAAKWTRFFESMSD